MDKPSNKKNKNDNRQNYKDYGTSTIKKSLKPKVLEKIFTITDYQTKYTGNNELDRSLFLNACQDALKNDFNNDLYEKINLAIDLVFDAFANSKPREDGTKVYTHFFETAEILMREFQVKNKDAIISAILHDGPEDAPEKISLELIANKFGKSIKEIVEGVTKITSETDLKEKGLTEQEYNHKLTYDELEIASLMKIITLGSKQPLVYFLKFADRYHNILTLYGKKNPLRRRELAKQTLRIYIPLMKILNCHEQARKLSELCLLHILSDKQEEAQNLLEHLKATHKQLGEKFIYRLQKEYIQYDKEKINIEEWFDRNFNDLFFFISHNSLYELYLVLSSNNNKVPDNYSHFFIQLVPKVAQDKNSIDITINRLREELKTSFIYRKDQSELQPNEDWYPSFFERTLHTFWVSTQETQEDLVIKLHYQPENDSNIKIDRTNLIVQFKNTISDDELKAFIEIVNDLINDSITVRTKIDKVFLYFEKLYPLTYVAVTLHNNHTRYFLPKGSTPLDLAFKADKSWGLRFLSANKLISDSLSSIFQNVPLDYKLQDNDTIELILSNEAHTFSTSLDKVISSVYTLTAFNELRKLRKNKQSQILSTYTDKKINKTLKIRGINVYGLSTKLSELAHSKQLDFSHINLALDESDSNYFNGTFQFTAPNEIAVSFFILDLLKIPEIFFIEII